MRDKTLYTKAPAYYHSYFDLVESDDLMEALRLNLAETTKLVSGISDVQWHSAYAPGKWTVAQVFRHIIETERIFAYRAMRFSRFDTTPLPGFDENKYIGQLQDELFSKEQLLREFAAQREATLCLFESMTPAMKSFEGVANGVCVNASMLGFMIVGHTRHHLRVIEERY